jgi:hypothetical protein
VSITGACVILECGEHMYRRIPQVTQTKINELLEELRSWEPGEIPSTLHELAERFDLDVFVIDRLARAEGVKVPAGVPAEEGEDPLTDPNASTLDLDPDRVDAAARRPDPNPDWADKDADTGVWRKKPTGEYELVNDKKD